MQDKDLDGLLALAARDRPEPSAAVMDRVLADAWALQPQPTTVRVAPAPRPAGQGLLARLAAVFGGGAVLAGVTSAAMAGVALGYFEPVSMDALSGGLTGALTGTETLELFPSADFLTDEG